MGLRFSVAAAVAVLLYGAPAGAGPVILAEDFSTDPTASVPARANVVGDSSRFDYAGGILTAHYDTTQPTTTLNWALGTTLTQADSFTYTTTFRIRNPVVTGFSGGQVSFGLINSSTTGGNRAGNGPGPYSYDAVTFDYFPVPGFITVTPTVIESPSAKLYADAFAADSAQSVHYARGANSLADADLPSDTFLTATLTYLASDRSVTLTTTGVTYKSGTATSSTFTLDSSYVFSVDTFAIALWNDSYYDPAFGDAYAALVDFTGFSVSPVPEPSHLLLFAALLLVGAGYVRRAAELTTPKEG